MLLITQLCGWHLVVQFIHQTLKYVVTALIKKHLSLAVAV